MPRGLNEGNVGRRVCPWFWKSIYGSLLAKTSETIQASFTLQPYKQEALGPRFAHLSDIATADMHLLCNIFPILSLQLVKISSIEQFLVLKKNIWAWQSMEHDHLNKLSVTFQQKDQCEIWWESAKFLFVCVEVLRPSQPSGVMSSAVSLPNHTFTGQA